MNENCTDEFTGKLEQNVDHISKNNLQKIQQRTISSPSIRAKSTPTKNKKLKLGLDIIKF